MSGGLAAARIAGVVLAAGRSIRMGDANKLLARVGGVPMVRRVVETAIGAALDPVVVVLGHEAAAVRRGLGGLPVRFAVNDRYADGIGTSVGAGIRAIAGEAEGAMVLLGDMPWISAADLRALTEAFAPDLGRGICAPVVNGRRGNPVLWGERWFDALQRLEGDVGARGLLTEHSGEVFPVCLDGERVFRDVDTPAALEASLVEEG